VPFLLLLYLALLAKHGSDDGVTSSGGGHSNSGSSDDSGSGSSGANSHDDSNSGSSGSNSGSSGGNGGSNKSTNSRTRLKGNLVALLQVGKGKIRFENRTKIKKNQERQEQELDLRVSLPLTVEALELTPQNGADLDLVARFSGDVDGDQVGDTVADCTLAFKVDDDNDSLKHEYRVKVKSRTGKDDKNYYGSSCDNTTNLKFTERVTVFHVGEGETPTETPIFEFIK
jgi:hypothetical protein